MDQYEYRFLGARDIPADLSAFDIEFCFSLSDYDLSALASRRGALNRLGAALQLCFIRTAGRFLNSSKLVSPEILHHLSAQLGISSPDLASIRSLYHRRRTLHDHQRWACEYSGFQTLTNVCVRGLTAHLRKEAVGTADNSALYRNGMIWLFHHHYILPPRRTLFTHVRDARRFQENVLIREIEAAVSREAIDAVTAHIEKCNKRSALILLDTVGKKWREGLTSDDEGRVIKTASAAGAIIIKRLLKNGSLGVVHSIEHRNPETRLIPKDQWEQSQARYIRNLGLTKNVGTYLKHLKPVLRAGLDQLALAIRQGDLTIKDGRLIVPRLQSAQTSPEVGVVRRRLFDMIGEAQLPDVLINVDAATGFSSKLLGRPARSDKELVTLYASTLALGTDLTAASAARMVAGVEAKAIARMMARLVASGTLPAANRAVLEFAAAHDIAKLWGPGTTASSDMMSLEASRHLWSTRIDPRRRSYSIGAYTHVLDQWSIIYDQPIVLNRRQAGAAIEGALRQTTTTIDRLAVDTHGHTHFAMALAKCCGFDLCPRLAGLHNRKLYLPKGFMVPNELKDIVSPSISTRTIANGWDGLLRLASSVQQGWVPATFAMDRFGSAAKGDPIYEAGVGLGKLLLTLYLCDYLTKEDFQREIGRLLSQGESIHILQRAIHSKPLGAKTGRDIEELTAISNALTLLTKIVVAWNTASMEQVIKSAPADWRQEHVRHIAPIAHAHINLRGVMTFDLGKHRDNPFGGEQNKKAHSENVKPNLQINSTP